ncbi:polymorphic toxin-type HINT domain-containing protein [Brevibacillus borstelensis]|uniref:polymorphic toxin-type HINT domain-containing protein n=2 Tax=Brevibacillus borstelensis TaxID=45462 RepID=UPI001D0B880B|nr:Hint domain-containing protein [Brevibacillus borstelensis]MCM3473604.1 polymorphic toxin-type HINT domain-containing protein [Brevibacillus borstelensis]MCM3561722.1 polymorphic toxin-type HINT domain-containing protein [Brevibacillus borstelensis]MCM3623553.1 polymorphic toxin-type HINT domain-containing protein [Brevibacillus borstelensis]
MQVTENNTQTTKYHYNALSWKISETDVPSGATETFGYTPNGKVSVFTDKAGNRHEYAYTPFYELSELTTKDTAGTVKNRETKEYYPNTSLVKKETNSNGPNIQSTSPLYRELFYTYDPFLRMNSFTAFGRLYQIRHTDADDQMDQLIYPGNTAVSYRYDDAMRLTEVTSPGLDGTPKTVRYAYELSDAGDTYTLTYPNGVSLVRKRDSFGQVDTLKHFKSGTSVWQEKNSYSFGNVTSIERNGTTYRYEYDKVDRLTKENVPAGENRYSYNGRGSRMTFEGTLPAMPSTATYTFDERNRLRGVTNEKTGAKAEYTYYPDGLRATKTADGGETRYVYLNGRVIEELDKNGQLKAQNIWGNELLSRKDVAANKRGYYLYNSHGDVVKVVGENGEELNRYEYDTWGNLTAKTEGMSNPFTYSGEILDGETGFYYLRARYYDPTVGRFISEDTYKGQVDNPLSLNRYAYVHNNPLRYVDFSGNVITEPWGNGGIRKDSTGILRTNDGKGNVYWEFYRNASVDEVPEEIRSEVHGNTREPEWYEDPFTYVAGAGGVVKAVAGKVVGSGARTVEKGIVKKLFGCNCFTAGTKVQTDEGEKNIEDIEVGDKVLSKDDETGEMAYKEVEWLFQRDVEETYNITVGDEVITTTDEHPFWIVGKGWVESKNLTVGDVLTTTDGKELAIEKIEVKKEHKTVYNFKVRDFHTYFVSNLGIWTHNSCGFDVSISKSAERVAKKLSPEARKGYDNAIEALKKGDTRGLNEHALSGDRKGQWAVDIKGTGKGRGAGRIIYTKDSDGNISVIEVLTDHKY